MRAKEAKEIATKVYYDAGGAVLEEIYKAIANAAKRGEFTLHTKVNKKHMHEVQHRLLNLGYTISSDVPTTDGNCNLQILWG